jgi:hypothetical protein
MLTLAIAIAMSFNQPLSVPTATSASVEKVADVIMTGKAKHTVLDKVDEQGNRRVVFDFRGRRYTFMIDRGKTLLNVWIKPSKKTGQDSVGMISDVGLTGEVAFGVTATGKKLYQKENRYSGPESTKVDDTYKAYWQKLYDTAINAGLKRLF